MCRWLAVASLSLIMVPPLDAHTSWSVNPKGPRVAKCKILRSAAYPYCNDGSGGSLAFRASRGPEPAVRLIKSGSEYESEVVHRCYAPGSGKIDGIASDWRRDVYFASDGLTNTIDEISF